MIVGGALAYGVVRPAPAVAMPHPLDVRPLCVAFGLGGPVTVDCPIWLARRRPATWPFMLVVGGIALHDPGGRLRHPQADPVPEVFRLRGLHLLTIVAASCHAVPSRPIVL